MFSLSRQGVLRKHFHPHFHRCMKHTIHLRLQNHDLTHVDGIPEIDVIHRSCHHVTVRMPARRHRCRHVHQVHHVSAQQLSERIRFRGQHHLRHLRSRSMNCFTFHGGLARSLFSRLCFHFALVAGLYTVPTAAMSSL